MPRNGRTPVVSGIAPPRVSPALADEHAAVPAEVGSTASAASRRQTHFLERPARRGSGIGPVHFQCLRERVLEVFQQLLSRPALGIDAWYFLDPTDPPFVILLDDRRVSSLP